MQYNELRATLKDFRDNHGYELTCKLNAKKAVLEAEYERIMDLAGDDGTLEAIAQEVDNAVTQITDIPETEEISEDVTEITAKTKLSVTSPIYCLLWMLAICLFIIGVTCECLIRVVKFTIQVTLPYCTDKLTDLINYLFPDTQAERSYQAVKSMMQME